MQDKEALRIVASLDPCVDEIGAAMQVMSAAFPPEFGEAWSSAQLMGMMQLPGSILVTGYTHAGPVGFGLIRSIAGEAELLLLAVHPNHRGRTHGRRLLDRCMTEAEGTGAETIFLEVRSGNPALHLYIKAGFHQYNVRLNYYCGSNGSRFDALSLKLVLGQGAS
ncbi:MULTISPECIES: GNAT family N-acetyltransferase [unclassified Sphingobium]|uniref:GNAT family N-acetyltransferase n=1 Tax=unclassified Sphingobium TaxID=2611147 RepID=UPI0022240C94|nr:MULTISPECIES: GNAT family N-acetyltransferase [unclassified Sphingobium]MCW2411823.1 ribosomal-protein-alanine N-acetyltransferase [Sphingobium sp. B8D3D]MCW2415879.1 ribosomal-protein-alanine N-acetyltransferase [Sphingobium sp. B8D3A]